MRMLSPPAGAEKPKSAKDILRDQRLKAALKANMGRRKAQARARADGSDIENELADDAGANNKKNE